MLAKTAEAHTHLKGSVWSMSPNTGHLLQLLTQKTQEEEIGNAVRIVKDEMIIVATRKKWHLAV
jgi:hypothetical protein